MGSEQLFPLVEYSPGLSLENLLSTVSGGDNIEIEDYSEVVEESKEVTVIYYVPETESNQEAVSQEEIVLPQTMFDDWVFNDFLELYVVSVFIGFCFVMLPLLGAVVVRVARQVLNIITKQVSD